MTKSKPAKTAPHPDFPLPHPGASIADAIEGSGDTKIKGQRSSGLAAEPFMTCSTARRL
jgi:hypothetical protein